MNKASSVYVALAALISAVDARNPHQPRATAASDFSADGFSPKPTYAPEFHDALVRRATASSIETAYIAPDNTCGFISGLPGAGYTCGLGGTCVFYTASTAPGHVACCNTVDCNARVTCIDYVGYFSQSKCDNGCAVDTFTLKCTNTALPYCNTLSFPGNIMDVFCNNVNITGIQAASTTYKGQSSRIFTPIALTGTGSSTSSPVFPSASSSSSSSSSTASTSTGPGGDGGSNNGNGGNNGSNGNNGNNNSGGGGSSTPTGAIVGGVVGGVGGLALIGAAIFFFLRRNRKNATPAPTEQPPPAAPYQSPPMQQGQQQFYDPKFAAATSQQSYTPPNQQQYVQPQQQQGFYAPQSPDGTQTMSPVSQTDPRYSVAQNSTSPTPSGGFVPPAAGGFQPQQGAIHEAPAVPADHHHGQMHELA